MDLLGRRACCSLYFGLYSLFEGPIEVFQGGRGILYKDLKKCEMEKTRRRSFEKPVPILDSAAEPSPLAVHCLAVIPSRSVATIEKV